MQPALSDNPGQADAFDRAERLLATAGNFNQLSKLFARRIAACGVDPGEKIDLLRRHARLLHHKLGDPAGAISELGELLALRPDDREALSERADLLCAQGRWSDAADTLGMLIERVAAALMADPPLVLPLPEMVQVVRVADMIRAARAVKEEDEKRLQGAPEARPERHLPRVGLEPHRMYSRMQEGGVRRNPSVTGRCQYRRCSAKA